MMAIFNTVVALGIAFLMLRRSGTMKRHVLAFFVTGLVGGIVAFVLFSLFNPYGGYTDAARYHASLDGQIAWLVGLLVGFALGAVAARLVRPTTGPTTA
ncbi:hypothetical protein JQ604_05345 [Bradyrhizobium jicamae]|uniref:YtxH domain-containing protein n=1 Tax=Bradyrhizobium jicamae TaxID=280332 RepID=UPI001BA80A1F|nr:YtxH domain-containing protein [Bradyrhizobium jicamae]MBR0751598.1 hypothetical protein [Bradyrhizobium jicamae]